MSVYETLAGPKYAEHCAVGGHSGVLLKESGHDFPDAASAPASVPRQMETHVQFVDAAHQQLVGMADRLRLVIRARSRDADEFRLSRNRQRMRTVDHRFTLSSPALPSAPDKKSFSSVNWPIFACNESERRPQITLMLWPVRYFVNFDRSWPVSPVAFHYDYPWPYAGCAKLHALR